MMHGRKALLLMAVCAGALASAQTVLAAAAPNFSLRPTTYRPALPETKSYFVLDLRPGATVTEKVRVSNVGSATGTLKLYAVDATTGQTSGTVYESSATAKHDAGKWISLGTRRLTLRPRESRVVTFTLRVPTGARTGDHVGGIVAENEQLTKPIGSKSAMQISIRHLTVAAVVVRVPGLAAARLNIQRVAAVGEHGYQFLRLDLGNGGNVMIKPTGRLLLRNGSGKTIVNKQIRLDTLIPHTQIGYPVSVPTALSPGRYSGLIVLSYGNRVLVNGQGVGGPLTLRRTFSFSVSQAQNTQVYEGAPQLTRPAVSTVGHSSRSVGLVVAWILAAIAALACFFLLILFARRRRTVS
jgi:hypothetical protein